MIQRPRVIKTTTKAASGGVIVIAAILALLFFRGPGLGTGESDSENETSGTDRPAMATTEPVTTTGGSPTTPSESPDVTDDSGGLTPDEQKALSGKVLGILIDEYSYRMEVPGDATPIYREAELQRLVQLAKQADGDSNGIRVRILRRENARASTEEQLKLELSRVGINSDAFYMPETFVP